MYQVEKIDQLRPGPDRKVVKNDQRHIYITDDRTNLSLTLVALVIIIASNSTINKHSRASGI